MQRFIATMWLFAGGTGCVLAAGNESSLWLEYQRSSSDSEQYAVELNAAIGRGDLLTLRAMHAQLPLTSGDIVDGNEYKIGWDTRLLQPWLFSLEYYYWGQSNEYTSDNVSLGSFYEHIDWRFGVNLEYHWLTFHSRTLLNGRQYTIEEESFGYGPEVDYYGSAWSWELFGYKYDYQGDPSRLSSVLALRILGGRTVTLAGDLNDWLAGTELHYQFSQVRIGATWTHAVSAITETYVEIYSAVLYTELGQNIGVELEYGISKPEIGEQSEFGVVRLGFYY